jgi:hypothetical protein
MEDVLPASVVKLFGASRIVVVIGPVSAKEAVVAADGKLVIKTSPQIPFRNNFDMKSPSFAKFPHHL